MMEIETTYVGKQLHGLPGIVTPSFNIGLGR